jgi:toxin secretion/phage lysis holin
MKDKFLFIVGLIGSYISFFLGGWNGALTSLFIFMGIDILTGWMIAGIFKNSPKTESGALSSKVGFLGLCKKCLIIVWILVAYRLDLTLNTDYIRFGVIYAFMANELLSIAENSSLLGFPLPKIISNAIDILKSKGNKE